MRRGITAVLLVIMFVSFALAAARPGAALPEYSEQTGEPCATCHASASGGGMRTPRGQAWVGEGRGWAVPDLAAALEILGVRLTVNEVDFRAPAGAAGGSERLAPAPVEAARLGDLLRSYEGN